jgi:hypothetical protein
MEPVLKLASMFIYNASIWEWSVFQPFKFSKCELPSDYLLYRWDALFLGEYRKINAARLPKNRRNETYMSFQVRNQEHRNTPEAVRMVQEKLAAYAKEIKFGFFCGFTDAMTGIEIVDKNADVPGPGHNDGITIHTKLLESTMCYISLEIIAGLLRDDLTTAEL